MQLNIQYLLVLSLAMIYLGACENKPTSSISAEDSEAKGLVITNPVLPGDRPDPTVIQIGDVYYASTTSNEWAPLFPIFKSTDLQNWVLINYVFPDGAPSWARNNFWAPELSYDEKQGKIYAYYTARDIESGRLSVAVASATSPLETFIDHGPLVAQEFGSIDAFEVRDENDKLYVLWKEDGNSQGQPTPMWAQEIDEDRTGMLGEPVELFRNDMPWEKNLIEGVAVFRKNGYFYATYSSGACCDIHCDYQAGVARSKNLLGPWEKYGENPILADNEDWICGGHGTVVKMDDDHYFLYHAYSRDGTVYVGREGVLEKFVWSEDGWPLLKNDANYSLNLEQMNFLDNFDPELNAVWQWRVTQDIQFETGAAGLNLQASLENQDLGTLLVQGTKSTDYELETLLDLDHSSAAGGILLVGAAHNGFGAPIAGMGIGVGDGVLKVFQTREGETSDLGEKQVNTTGTMHLKMSVEKGHIIEFSYKSADSDWIVLDLKADASPLVPWGMGFRLGMFAKGDSDKSVNFLETRISY